MSWKAATATANWSRVAPWTPAYRASQRRAARSNACGSRSRITRHTRRASSRLTRGSSAAAPRIRVRSGCRFPVRVGISHRANRELTRTYVRTEPPRSAKPVVRKDYVGASLGGAERLGVEPPVCPPTAYTSGCLAKRRQAGANLIGEELRLLPGRDVVALVDFVEVDELG